MFVESWPQPTVLEMQYKQDMDSMEQADGHPPGSSGRAKRTRKPSQRQVERDDQEAPAPITRERPAAAATPSTSCGSPTDKPRGRGRQRANPGAPETAQQRAHRKFYLRKKEMLSSLEAIAAAKVEEYETLRAENAALRRKHDALAATVAGRDDMLGVLSAISNLSLQEQQQLEEPLPSPPRSQQLRQCQTPSTQSELQTDEGLHSDGSGMAGDGDARGAAATLWALTSDQQDEEELLVQLQEAPGCVGSTIAAMDGPDASDVPGASAAADTTMAELLAGFMQGLEASGGTAARHALQASLAMDMQQQQQTQQQPRQHGQQQQRRQQQQQQQQQHQQGHESSGSFSSTSTQEPTHSGSSAEAGSSGSPMGGGPFSLGGMVAWYREAIRRLSKQLHLVDQGDGGDVAAQQELERQVNVIIDRLRKYAVIDRVHHRELMLINMETGERDTPPRGHWERVDAAVPLDEAKMAQLLACHEVYCEHMVAVKQERTKLARELQRAISSMPQGDAALSSSTRRLDQRQKGQGQGQGGELVFLDSMLLPVQQQQQQQQQQRHFSALSEAEAALALMGDLWDDKQQQQSSASMAWGVDPPSSSYAAAQQLPSRHSLNPSPGPDATSLDACLMAANMTLLKRINDNLAREDLISTMLAYALHHVLSLTDIARSMVSSWPFYPDTPEVVAATVAAATASTAAVRPARAGAAHGHALKSTVAC